MAFFNVIFVCCVCWRLPQCANINPDKDISQIENRELCKKYRHVNKIGIWTCPRTWEEILGIQLSWPFTSGYPDYDRAGIWSLKGQICRSGERNDDSRGGGEFCPRSWSKREATVKGLAHVGHSDPSSFKHHPFLFIYLILLVTYYLKCK